MQKTNSTTNKKNLLSNFVYQTNHKVRNGFKAGSFIDFSHKDYKVVENSPRKSQNICTQTNFSSSTSVDLKARKVDIFKETCTQTSKTTLSLILPEIDSARLSPDSLSPQNEIRKECDGDNVTLDGSSGLSVREFDCAPFHGKNSIMQYLKEDNGCNPYWFELSTGNALTKVYLEKNREKLGHLTELKSTGHIENNTTKQSYQNQFRSQSYIDTPLNTFLPNLTEDVNPKLTRFHVKNVNEKFMEETTKPHNLLCQPLVKMQFPEEKSADLKTKRSTSFMSPTIASESKDQRIEIECIKKLISPTRKGRSASPKNFIVENISAAGKAKIVPYIDKSRTASRTDMEKNCENGNQMNLNLKLSAVTCCSALETATSTTTSTECALFQAITKLRDKDWNTALRGLAEIVEICRLLDADIAYPHMTIINQRLIELIKSPRSHVCRTSCQAIGHLFEYVKDTRRPEFDELVDTLLFKTADANKFIRHDANLALDCMVTHIPTFHAVRALCSKGPDHKNSLVRIATARLLVCTLVISGPQTILHPHNNEYTRKRIILNMVKFMEDRNGEIRKFGERIYKLLHKERIFDMYLKRYIEKDVIMKIKQCVKRSNGQQL